ncbi:MAG: DUF4126 domain-containing protein [Actinomycetota bacterium]|nr:DUF4126 domain-containing protein [Actinomycetota bacterium]
MDTAIPLAFTAAWASGINPYLLVLMLGLLGRFAGADVPVGLERLDVILVFAVLTLVDSIADKVMYLDSAWDALNTLIRPVAGAVVAALIASPHVDLPTAAIAAAGGAVALIAHLAKATTRLAVNSSPEPASNIVVSVIEDLAVAGVVVIALLNPWVAAGIAMGLLIGGVVVALVLAKAVRAGWRRVYRRSSAQAAA